jgi:hypothetical protein
MRIELALGGGGGGEPCWLYLPLAGRGPWDRLLGSLSFELSELHATSLAGDLHHPGEVALASPTTLAELHADLAAELGSGARVVDLALVLPDGVRLQSHDERSLRLEAPAPEAFAPWLERLHGVAAERWRRLLPRLHQELLTGVHLALEVRPASFLVTGPESLEIPA